MLAHSTSQDKPTLTNAILDRVESKAGAEKRKKRQTTLLDFDDGLAHRQWVMDRLGMSCVQLPGPPFSPIFQAYAYVSTNTYTNSCFVSTSSTYDGKPTRSPTIPF